MKPCNDSCRMTPQRVADLRDFVTLLEERDALRRVGVEVDPYLEIAAITDRVCKGAAGGRALYFERVKGHGMPLLTNLFGSVQRAAWAVGLEAPDQLRGILASELAQYASGSASERFCRLLREAIWQPQLVSAGPCREVVSPEPDLRRLPALHCWPDDGGRFLTQPLVFSQDPETGLENCGMYRVQIFGRDEATLRWRPGSDGARHHAAWTRRGAAMPVAIALGGDPATIYAASAPLPDKAGELVLAGLLRRRPLPMVSCLTSSLRVPAAAEIVIEGLIEPGASRSEGPFGNHCGSYDPAAPAALLRVTSLTHRQNPLFPATITGPPPMESAYLAKLSERLLLALLQADFPQIVDIHMPLATIFHGVTLLAVNTERNTDVTDLAQALWQRRPFSQARLLLFFDEQTDVQDVQGCFWRAINRARADKDLLRHGPGLAIDATRLAGRSLAVNPLLQNLLESRWNDYGLNV